MDDDDLSDALEKLTAVLERQTGLQQQTNELLKTLIGAIDDLADLIGQLGSIDDEISGPN